jgi:hypothetical protein
MKELCREDQLIKLREISRQFDTMLQEIDIIDDNYDLDNDIRKSILGFREGIENGTHDACMSQFNRHEDLFEEENYFNTLYTSESFSLYGDSLKAHELGLRAQMISNADHYAEAR